MKNVYVIDVNRNLGSRHWYMDRIYTTKKEATKHGKWIKEKFKNGGYTITEWRLYT